MIDLRSDTVTLPSPDMRRAMAEAELGDDVFGEDPTVRALEERAAELLDTEAGLLVTSGTMGNLVGLMAHVPRGGEIIGPAEIHTFSSEGAGHAVVVGASVRGLAPADDGTLDPAAIRAAVRDPTDVHEPITALITLENTHAHSMGRPLTPAYEREVVILRMAARRGGGAGDPRRALGPHGGAPVAPHRDDPDHRGAQGGQARRPESRCGADGAGHGDQLRGLRVRERATEAQAVS